MFIYLRLLLAHFIGDFPLQTNYIFKIKLKGIRGVAIHALIVFLAGLFLSWPYLNLLFTWAFLFFIFITHFIQDAMKIKYSTAKSSFWTYLLDQMSHVGIISLVFFTSLVDVPDPVFTPNIFAQLYLNNNFIIYCILMIVATYNGYFLIRCFHDTFLDRANYNSVEKWYGMIERATIVLMFIFKRSSLFLVIAPALITLRLSFYYFFKNKLTLQNDFASLREILLSWSVAMISSLPLMLF
ncbi:MAG: hypothetical protein A2267_01955 [Omnitrophica WOR_2 bacterium RIFOXYA12_FULL_38_10]|nr:MAG: hypothetical protein A2267_01955 [Omnitrophica WOR_2 bacterium RIFOXYA12_FULL_38_10]